MNRQEPIFDVIFVALSSATSVASVTSGDFFTISPSFEYDISRTFSKIAAKFHEN